jgi:hypothetical protein
MSRAPRRYAALVPFIAIFTASLAVTAPARSQTSRPASKQPAATAALDAPANVLGRLRASGLASSTDIITVFYPDQLEARALADRARVQGAMRFFADSLGVTPEITLGVLDRRTWESLGVPQPYGIPGVEGEPSVAYVPATDDGLAATDALSIAAAVGDSARRLLAAAGTDWERAARSHVALVGLHELGHTLVSAYGIRTRSPWLGEWLATYAAYTYMRAERPSEALVWEGVLQGFRDAVQPEHRSLSEFDRLYFGVGALNYVWYQARFQQQVQAVHAAQGVEFLRRVRAAFGPDAPPASPEEVLDRLERVAPGFRAWAAEMR